MAEPGMGPLALAAIILSLVGVYGASMKAEQDNLPGMVVMDRHKSNCAGMAGFFGCER
ncbi:MAG: hypothetical protein AAGO57_04610 [Pseudomonadota bacterium]